MAADLDGGMAIDRLRDHYKHCIRLSASNKINPKNAFDLQLIDYMQDLVSSNEDGQMNFKIASSALDVGAKIYSNRVDRIQSEAQKVASSILMALDGQQNNNKNGDNQDDTQMDGDTSANSDRLNNSHDDENQPKQSKKKRPNRTKNVKTVVEDESLLDARLEKMVLGDAFLDGLSQDYDMSCPAALICYNALTQPIGLLTIESGHLRKNYQAQMEQPAANKSSTTNNLETIHEEKDESRVEDGNNDSKSGSSKRKHQNDHDEDGDTVMKDDHLHGSSSDKTATTSTTTSSHATINHTRASMASSSNRSRDHHNLVTLITKNVNCAQLIRDNQNNRICPRLENFLFNDRTTTIAGLGSNLDDSKAYFPGSSPNNLNGNSGQPTGGAHEFDPELYENNHDDYGDDHFGDAESTLGNGENHQDENDLIPDLDKIAASKPSEYGYLNEHPRLLNTWAGPHAWKVKAPQTAKKDVPPKSARKRAKLDQKPIDFLEEVDTNREISADKEIRLPSDTLKRWKKIFIPQDHRLDEESIVTTLAHTFLRPEETYHCMKTPADALKVVDSDHDYTKTDRDIDDEPATPGGLGCFDDVHDDSDDEFRADPVVDGNEVAIYGALINNTLTQQADLEFAGENLIEQPYTVAHVNIPFAKIAKKMDVRRLKRVMWDLLLPPEKRLELTMQANVTVIDNGSGDTDNNNAKQSENDHTTVMSGDEHNETVIMNGDTNNATEKTAKTKTPSPTPSESAVHLEFSHLYCELPVRVSSKMASDLSQPIAFVTLLHLANEKNLKLIPNKDLKDFIIEQDELI